MCLTAILIGEDQNMDLEDCILGTMKESIIFGPNSNKWV
jgi:hypothetical protein